jgi:hypothetical protein
MPAIDVMDAARHARGNFGEVVHFRQFRHGRPPDMSFRRRLGSFYRGYLTFFFRTRQSQSWQSAAREEPGTTAGLLTKVFWRIAIYKRRGLRYLYSTK